ncbi:hypothetical protein [Diaphorobacter sp. MNS-0]|uniref:hypothetical protein n=1 Tax=Diaphorobacter sp. MNS-0 TaxID=2866628 RepID=UPI001C72B1EF|nr:hypothetical protein [Diaphorobacter sp. MNS-0]QYY25297.1 hypothetical protein K2L43_16760 [Diaphorobacter sp. MNS-0]
MSQANVADGSLLYSFDLFDTLIERDTVEPESIFHFVQRELVRAGSQLPQSLIDNWPTLRQKAEADARHVKRRISFLHDEERLEVSFDEIYQRIASSYDLNDEQIRQLQELEIAAEIAHCRPINKRVEYLCALKTQGFPTVIITDMYLPRGVIERILGKAAPSLVGVPIFISSELGYQKQTGSMYKHIYSLIGPSLRRWIHYGDNALADGETPRKYGIEGVTHQIVKFSDMERAIIHNAPPNLKCDAYEIAAMMRQHRIGLLDAACSETLERKYYGYAYVGSALVPYVYWCIQNALRQRTQVLYFIARDGHILKAIADEIILAHSYPLQTKYIFGSRATWRVAAFSDDAIDPEFFGSYGNFYAVQTYDELLKATLLSEEEFFEFCPIAAGLQATDRLDPALVQRVVELLKNSKDYKNRLLAIAKQRRRLAVKYFQQEIDFDKKIAFVEFWGTGYTQEAFTRILNTAADRDIGSCFYYVRSYYGNRGNVIRKNFIASNITYVPFEAIFSDIDYHSIKEYIESDDGSVTPKIVPKRSSAFPHFVEGATRFTRDLLRINKTSDALIRYLSEISFSYQVSVKNDQFICSVLGELKYDYSGYDTPRKYAPPFSRDFLQSVKQPNDLLGESMSFEISYARSSAENRQLYDEQAARFGWPKLSSAPVKPSFAVDPLAQQLRFERLPCTVRALGDLPVYLDVSLSEASLLPDESIAQGAQVNVLAVDWTSLGQPRLLTDLGYISADAALLELV